MVGLRAAGVFILRERKLTWAGVRGNTKWQRWRHVGVRNRCGDYHGDSDPKHGRAGTLAVARLAEGSPALTNAGCRGGDAEISTKEQCLRRTQTRKSSEVSVNGTGVGNDGQQTPK